MNKIIEGVEGVEPSNNQYQDHYETRLRRTPL